MIAPAALVANGLAPSGCSRPRVLERSALDPQHRPTVSVLIPCYNYGQYLPGAVRSALDQQGVEVEVVIVDDASPDGSADVARRLAADDPRVRAVVHEQNLGHIETYNDGIRRCHGDYFALVSADDLLAPGALARAVALMEAHPSVGLVYGYCPDFSGDPPPARTRVRAWKVWSGIDWIHDCCTTANNALRSPEAVVRMSVQREVGGYRADLPHAGDFEMWMRIASVADVAFLPGVDQAFHRIHDNNMHRTTYSTYAIDVQQRSRSFDFLFDAADGLPNAPALRALASRTLAQKVLRDAANAYLYFGADDQQLDEYFDLALEQWPAARSLDEWKMIDRRRARVRAGGAQVPFPGLWRSARMARRRVQAPLEEQQRRWTGLTV